MILTEEERDYHAQFKKKDVNAERRKTAKEMLIKGNSVENVVRISEFPESEVLAIKAEIEKQ